MSSSDTAEENDESIILLWCAGEIQQQNTSNSICQNVKHRIKQERFAAISKTRDRYETASPARAIAVLGRDIDPVLV